MKLLYSGGSSCDTPTMKRLILIGSELVFMDRPSVTFGKWGTIGHESPLRRLDTRGEPVKISVVAAPSGPARRLYEPYAVADFGNPEFIRTVLEGLRRDATFASKLIQPAANYGGDIDGRKIVDALSSDPTLTPCPIEQESDPDRMFAIQTLEDRRATLKILLVDASILVTSALVVADEAQAAPVADDPYLLRLLSQRMSSNKYVGGSSPHAWLLGMEFARSVIPDEALQKLSVADVVEYRRKSQDVFQAWTGELNQIASKIDDISVPEAIEKIPKLIITELHPRVAAYKSEMVATRDALFGDLVKGVMNWKVPGLSFGSMATMGFGAAAAAFAVMTAGTVATSMVDFYKARRAAVRKHAVSYLIGLEDP